MIYFDNAATTKPCKEAVEAIQYGLTELWGNPSAQYHFGVETARALRQARQTVAEALGAPVDKVYFTSGGTEADNWAVFAAAERLGKRGKHIITTAVEHSAVLMPMAKLEAQGFEVTYLKPDRKGRISLESLSAALRPDTILVSIMMVNNESGAVMPIEKMAKLVHLRCPNALFHTDAVQGFMKVPFRASTLGADLISVSGHKIHATKGIGALYCKGSLPAMILGGGQESAMRSGTENVPMILGFAAACKKGLAERAEAIRRQNSLKSRLQEGLSQMEGIHLLGAQEAPHIVNMAVPGLRSQGLINRLYDKGFCVSAGSACSKGHRSRILEAMEVAPELIDGSIRISLSGETTEGEIDAFLDTLPTVIHSLR